MGLVQILFFSVEFFSTLALLKVLFCSWGMERYIVDFLPMYSCPSDALTPVVHTNGKTGFMFPPPSYFRQNDLKNLKEPCVTSLYTSYIASRGDYSDAVSARKTVISSRDSLVGMDPESRAALQRNPSVMKDRYLNYILTHYIPSLEAAKDLNPNPLDREIEVSPVPEPQVPEKKNELEDFYGERISNVLGMCVVMALPVFLLLLSYFESGEGTHHSMEVLEF